MLGYGSKSRLVTPSKSNATATAATGATGIISKQKEKPSHFGRRNQCLCSVPDCNELFHTIQQLAPEGHVWKGKLEITRKPETSGTTFKQNVFMESVRFHIKTSVDLNMAGVHYFINNFHFPEKLLQDKVTTNRCITTFLTEQQGQKIDSGDRNLFDHQNKVSSVARRLGIFLTSSEEIKYVQAPCQPISDVRTYAKALISGRALRTSTLTRNDNAVADSSGPTSNTNREPFSNMLNKNTDDKEGELMVADCDQAIVDPAGTAGLTEVENTPPINSNEMSPPVVPFVFPTLEQLHSIITAEYNKASALCSPFELNDTIKQAILLIVKHYKKYNPILIRPQLFLYFCSGFGDDPNCQGFKIVKRRPRVFLCSNCSCKEYNESRKRVRDDAPVVEQDKELKKSKLPSQQEITTADSVETSASDFLSKVKAFLISNKPNVQNDVVKILMEVAAKDGSVDSLKVDEQASFLLEQMINMGKVAAGNKTGVRYSAPTMRATVSMYLASPKAVEQLSASKLLILPKKRHFQRFMSDLKSKPGRDTKSFKIFHNIFGRSTSKIMAHLLCDEMDFDQDFEINQNGDLSAYTSNTRHNTLNLKASIKTLKDRIVHHSLEDESTDQSICSPCPTHHQDEPTQNTTSFIVQATEDSLAHVHYDSNVQAKKINQWRLRSSRKITEKGFIHNGPFFYNGGSATGDCFLNEFMWCVVCYDIVGVETVGFGSDAGGGNAGLHTIMNSIGSEQKIDDTMTILPSDIVMIPNFIHSEKYIACWPCAVHVFKSCRNQVIHSVPQLVKGEITANDHCKSFQLDGKHFGRKVLDRMYERDEAQGLASSDSALRYGAVHPDDWNKMNVSLALEPFRAKAIASLIHHISLNLNIDIVAAVPRDNQTDNHWYQKIVELIIETAHSSNTSLELWEDIGFLRYAVAIHGIFVSRFLNKNAGVTSSNFTKEKNELESLLSFFTKWRAEAVSRKNSDPNWWRSSIAATTFLNLRRLISGFMSYCELIIQGAPHQDAAYIPYLHANESSLEALFAYARNMDKDKPSSYPLAVAGSNYTNASASHSLKNNKMYSVDHLDLKSEELLVMDDDTRRKKLERVREETFHEWKKQLRLPPKKFQYGMTEEEWLRYNTRAFPSSMLNDIKSLPNCSVLRILLEDFDLHKSWLDCLLEGEVGALAELAIGTQKEDWFHGLYYLEGDSEAHFKKFCQTVGTRIVDELIQSGRGSMRSATMTLEKWCEQNVMTASFTSRVYQYLISDEFEHLRLSTFQNELMPDGIRNDRSRTGPVSVAFILSELIRNKLYEFLIKQNMVEKFESTHIKEASGNYRFEVNRFCGAAIAGSISNLRGKPEHGALLKVMRFTDRDAQSMPEYCRENYSIRDQLVNQGGHSLVTPHFFGFFEAVMATMETYCLEQHLALDGDQAFIKFREAVLSKTSLRDLYERSIMSSAITVDSKVKEEVFNVVMMKTIRSFENAIACHHREASMKKHSAGKDNLKFRQRFKGEEPTKTGGNVCM